jgi:CheY-like chemotaxis protein
VYAEAAKVVAELRSLREKLKGTDGAEARLKLLLGLAHGSQSLGLKIDRQELRPAHILCLALDGLLKKLVEKPASATASTLDTVETALELLGDLCTPGVNPDLAAKPAISMLVVDDDVISRRAITGALQTAFLKPDTAVNGANSVTMALGQRYDVIFMDVQMPGMDGFTACEEIHKTGPNHATPIVFVTIQTDDKSRERAAAVGGSDFVTKPFLFVEITVKGLTFALRGRLEKEQAGSASAAAA